MGLKDNYDNIQKNWENAIKDTHPKPDPPKSGGGGCFIATAAFGNYHAPEVVYLSAFRDEVLSTSILGRKIIQAYYSVSPRIAKVIEKSNLLKRGTRELFLNPLIFALQLFRRTK